MPSSYVETVYVDPARLHAYPGNPNHGDVNLIRGSVRANGQYRPVIARPHPDIPGDYEILAGHATTEATGAEAGTVRIEAHHVDDATARRIVAVDNQAARKATMDEADLLKLLDRANADPAGLEGTGFDDVEFRNLVDRHMAAPGKTAPGEFAEYDESIPTEHQCPRCGYQWSGSSAPGGSDPDDDDDADGDGGES